MNIARVEAVFHTTNYGALFEEHDLTRAHYINLFIQKEHDQMQVRDLRKRMDENLPREKIAGKVRVWNNRYEIRIGCADWETSKLVADFVKGL